MDLEEFKKFDWSNIQNHRPQPRPEKISYAQARHTHNVPILITITTGKPHCVCYIEIDRIYWFDTNNKFYDAPLDHFWDGVVNYYKLHMENNIPTNPLVPICCNKPMEYLSLAYKCSECWRVI